MVLIFLFFISVILVSLRKWYTDEQGAKEEELGRLMERFPTYMHSLKSDSKNKGRRREKGKTGKEDVVEKGKKQNENEVENPDPEGIGENSAGKDDVGKKVVNQNEIDDPKELDSESDKDNDGESKKNGSEAIMDFEDMENDSESKKNGSEGINMDVEDVEKLSNGNDSESDKDHESKKNDNDSESTNMDCEDEELSSNENDSEHDRADEEEEEFSSSSNSESDRGVSGEFRIKSIHIEDEEAAVEIN